jgi:uncharacterized damage-inducible protein DinB
MIDMRSIDGAVSRLVQSVNSGEWNPVTELDRLRLAREQTLAVLHQVSAAQALWLPPGGKWSIAQIADHLLRSEEMYREQFRRLLEKGSPIDISMAELDVGFQGIPGSVIAAVELPMKIFNRFVPHIVRETIIRYPLIAALNPQASAPREGLDPRKLRNELAASLLETEAFFQAPMPANIHQLTINHPLMGNNTIPQLFSIMIAHEQRHQAQLADVLAAAGLQNRSLEPVNAAQLFQ